MLWDIVYALVGYDTEMETETDTDTDTGMGTGYLRAGNM